MTLTVRSWELPSDLFRDSIPRYDESYFWYCERCGRVYAKITAMTDGTLSRFQAKAGCCANCTPRPHQVPGGLSHGGYEPSWPIEVLAYQLNCELDFYESPLHPKRKIDE